MSMAYLFLSGQRHSKTVLIFRLEFGITLWQTFLLQYSLLFILVQNPCKVQVDYSLNMVDESLPTR